MTISRCNVGSIAFLHLLVFRQQFDYCIDRGGNHQFSATGNDSGCTEHPMDHPEGSNVHHFVHVVYLCDDNWFTFSLHVLRHSHKHKEGKEGENL